MPSALVEAISKVEQSSAKQTTKDLHALTAQLGAAKKQVQALKTARRKQEDAWVEFMQKTADAIEKGAADHQRRLADFAVKEEELMQKLSSARKGIRALTKDVEDGKVEEIDDSEPECMEVSAREDETEDAVVQAEKKLKTAMDAVFTFPKSGAASPRRRGVERTDPDATKVPAEAAAL